MADMQNNPLPQLVNQARERLGQELRAYAEQLQQLEQSLQALRDRQRQLEQSIEQHLVELANVRIEAAPAPESGGAQLEGLLAAVRELITATLPEQVLEVLTVEGQKLGVRSAVFDVAARRPGDRPPRVSRDSPRKSFGGWWSRSARRIPSGRVTKPEATSTQVKTR